MSLNNSRTFKAITYEEAKTKAASYCAYQERCHQEVRDKLYSFGLHQDDVEKLISYLISEGFINELRFSKAFAGGRFRIKKWGKLKIEKELRIRKISEACIKAGLAEIDDEDYLNTLRDLALKKNGLMEEVDTIIKKRKIAAFLTTKGYESSLIWDLLNQQF